MSSDDTTILASAKELKSLVYTADQMLLNQTPADHSDVQEHIGNVFSRLWLQLDEHRRLHQRKAAIIAEDLKKDLLPLILLTHNGERMYSKPRGYAGDYLTIRKIYDNEPRGVGRVGPILDKCFLNQPAAKATRNRRKFIFDELIQLLNTRHDSPLLITSLACGPAAEIFDVFDNWPIHTDLQVTLLDVDLHALADISDETILRGIERQITLLHGNLVYIISGRQQFNIPAQDLVYSHGLTDYFDDDFVVDLLNYMHAILKPGGKAIIGNVHPDNPDRALLDYVLDWPLVHRTEVEMNHLFSRSNFGRQCDKFNLEPERVIMFYEIIKR